MKTLDWNKPLRRKDGMPVVLIGKLPYPKNTSTFETRVCQAQNGAIIFYGENGAYMAQGENIFDLENPPEPRPINFGDIQNEEVFRLKRPTDLHYQFAYVMKNRILKTTGQIKNFLNDSDYYLSPEVLNYYSVIQVWRNGQWVSSITE